MPADSQLWDALVVGAGPAGCAAAYDLAASGCSVLLLDKRDFPRPKACAGALTRKAVRALRYSILPVEHQRVSVVRLTHEGEAPAHLRSRQAIGIMTVREELDAFCLRRTIAAGACFRRIGPILAVARRESEMTLSTAEQTYRARYLIGADGANSQIRTLCMADQSWFSKGFALEAQVWDGAAGDELLFDFSPVAQGYGWVFPKRDHLNIGLYCESLQSPLRREQLKQYIRAKAPETAQGERNLHVTGQYLGFGGWRHTPTDDRVLLTGDAGGFVDPLTGEGIYGAIVSGQAAAGAVITAIREGRRASETFAGETAAYRRTLAFSARAARAFYINPSRGFQAIRLPLLKRMLIDTYTNGLSVNDLATRLVRHLV